MHASPQRVEYLIEELPHTDGIEQMAGVLNEYGWRGWQLCALWGTRGVFMRAAAADEDAQGRADAQEPYCVEAPAPAADAGEAPQEGHAGDGHD